VPTTRALWQPHEIGSGIYHVMRGDDLNTSLKQFFEFLGTLGNPLVPVLERLTTLDILEKGVEIANDGRFFWEFSQFRW
jgi:hypothetical protein